MTNNKLRPRTDAPVASADPIQRRNALRTAHDKAYGTYAAQTQKRQAAEARAGALERRLHEAHAAAATGNGSSGGNIQSLEDELAQAQQAYDHHLRAANSALDAVKSVESQEAQMYSQHFAAFADEAEEVTVRAAAELRDFAAAWERAQAAWTRATEAWAPLSKAVCVTGVPPFPVSEHAMAEVINGTAVARPPGIGPYELNNPIDGDELLTA